MFVYVVIVVTITDVTIFITDPVRYFSHHH